MKVGYARVSKLDQNLDLQIDALKKEGCEKIYEEKISGIKERPELRELLNYLREGDLIVVWKLDRLGRSLKDLVDTIYDLDKRRIGFKSLHENIDTTTATGKLIFHIFGALAEFERNIIRERTTAGLESARSRGRKGGRPNKLTEKQKNQIKSLYLDNRMEIKDIIKIFRISKQTLYSYIKKKQSTSIS